ncbi:MAG: DUF4065 domain-containing protein [Eubacteriaceae bacterium]|nr:DUF4065 domain-containing protein [Eubacteriaceae bacterium]
MKEMITFCEKCRKIVGYKEEDKILKSELKGKSYQYQGKIALCEECGAEVYVAEIEDKNLKLLYDTYRKENYIIFLEKILEIPVKYAIGKRPLSNLLGWGEMTFSRYCEGDMPSKQYSDILQKIYDEPSFYLNILEENKKRITELTYKKSKEATELLLNEKNIENKIDIVIDYLLYKCEYITHLELQKILYYIQGFYYCFKKSYIFAEDCEAWVRGPVYPTVYQKYKEYQFNPINGVDDWDDTLLTNYEKAVLDSVIKNFCCYSGKTLEKFTHSEAPWLETRGDLLPTESSNRVISKELIGNFFCDIKSANNIITPSDIEKYSKYMFEKNN